MNRRYLNRCGKDRLMVLAYCYTIIPYMIIRFMSREELIGHLEGKRKFLL